MLNSVDFAKTIIDESNYEYVIINHFSQVMAMYFLTKDSDTIVIERQNMTPHGKLEFIARCINEKSKIDFINFLQQSISNFPQYCYNLNFEIVEHDNKKDMSILII